MKNYNFMECQKYIEAIKNKPLALGITAKEVPGYLANLESDWVLVAVQENLGIIIVPGQDGDFIGFYFKNNRFEREEILDSYRPEDGYHFSIFEIDTSNILSWLRSDQNSLVLEHEEINFELGWRLKKTMIGASDVIAIIYQWNNGSMLVCSKEKDSFSDPQKNIIGELALQAFRNHRQADTNCTIKILHASLENLEEEEHDAPLVDLPLPTKKISINPAVLELSNSSIPVVQEHDLTTPSILQEISDSNIPVASEQENTSNENWDATPFDNEDEENVSTAEIEENIEDEFLKADELPIVEDEEKYKKYTISRPPTASSKSSTATRYTPQNSSNTDAGSENTISTNSANNNEEIADVQFDENAAEDLNQSVILKSATEDPVLPHENAIHVIPTEPLKNSIVNDKEIKILSGFGIYLPYGELSRHEDIQKAYKNAVTTKKFRRDRSMGPTEKQLFRRLDLPIHLEQKIREIKIYITIAASVVAIILLQILISNLYEKYQIYQTKKRYCEEQLDSLENYCKKMDAKITLTEEMLNTLSQNYPADKGFPEASPEIFTKLGEIKNYLAECQDILRNSKDLYQKDLDKMFSFFSEKSVYISEINQSGVMEASTTHHKILEYLQNRSQQILNLAQYMDNIQKEEGRLHQACLILREHVVVLDQKNKTLQENWGIIQNKYSSRDNYPAPSDDAIALIETTKVQIENYRKSLREMEEIMVQDRNKALELAQQYLILGEVDASKLDACIKTLDDHITICQGILKERILKEETLSMSVKLNRLSEALQKQLEKIRKGRQTLEEFPKEFNAPRPDQTEATFLSNIEQESKKLADTLLDSGKLLHSNQVADAKNLLLPFIDKDFNQNKLKQIETSITDAIKIAQITKTRSETGREIANLLQIVQENLLSLDLEIKLTEEQGNVIIQNYPKKLNFPVLPASAIYYPKLTEGKNYQKQLKATVVQVDQYLKNSALDEAVQNLRQKKSLVEVTKKFLPRLKEINQNLEKHIKKCQEIADERKQLAQLKEKRNKIENYLQDLKPFLGDLIRDVKEYQQLEDPKENLPSEVNLVINKGQDISSKIEGILTIGDEHISKKEYESCQKIWDYEQVKDLLNRDYIALELNKYQGKISEQLRQTKDMIDLRKKKSEIKEITIELQNRKEEFQNYVAGIKNSFPEIEKKAQINPAYLDTCKKEYEKALQEADYEMSDIEKVLEKVQNDSESSRYDKALERLRPYSFKQNPSGTQLGFVRAIYNKFKKVSEGEGIPSAPVVSKNKPRIPGTWYNEITNAITTYESIEERQLKQKMNEKALRFYDRFTVEIANLKRIPIEIGELDRCIDSIKSNNGDIEAMLKYKIENALIPRQSREAKQTLDFFSSREIPIDNELLEKIKKFKEEVEKLKQDISSSPQIGEEQIKSLFKLGDNIYEKFMGEDYFRSISSVLLTLEAESKTTKEKK